MPPPKPLTAAPSPELDWSRKDTPIARNFDDIYFSVDGGLEETRTVFLNGCGLPARWENGQDHIIGELGFGSGLNFLTAWQAFEHYAAPQQHLHFISIEKFPFTEDMLRAALSHWPDLSEKAQRLAALWPGPVKGMHCLHLSPRITLTLYIGDVETALAQIQTRIDSWFLDGFSPAKNPAMWTEAIMQRLAQLSHSETRLASFTVAGHVRTALTQAGFSVSKAEGFGRKRHRLEASFPAGPIKQARDNLNPLIIGGGIAGASLVRAAKRAGLSPRLIHDDPDMARAASGNPAALIKPRLDVQDRPESRFFLAAYLHALRAYEQSGEIVARGIVQIAKDEAEEIRYKKILGNAPLPASHMQPSGTGIYFPKALIINPAQTTKAWRSVAPVQSAQIARITHKAGQWQACRENGDIIDQSALMILACGAGARQIEIEDKGTLAHILSLRFSRGQLSWAQGKINGAAAYGGYALSLGDDILLGATHDRLSEDDPYALRAEDDKKNLAGAHRFLNSDISLSGKKGRASIRVTTENTLPLMTELAPNLWIMTGLGSRGCVFAPLLSEQLISQITRQPAAALFKS